ncbi:MAG: hypothetical protein AB7U98_13645 [Candidatus Nitrosocosmicus sp.]
MGTVSSAESLATTMNGRTKPSVPWRVSQNGTWPNEITITNS